jgi:hypothetical protein
VFAHAWYSHALWLIGEEALAVRHADQGIALALRREHLFSQTIALAYAALLHQMRRDSQHVLEYAEGAVTLCERFGFAYYGDWARVLLGWVRGQDEPARGIETIESALERLDAQRARARRPYYLSLLADPYRRAGQSDRAALIVDTAIEMALARGDAWWLPALFLQKSELGPAVHRDASLRRGLEIAQAQHSLSLAQRLTAAMSAATT